MFFQLKSNSGTVFHLAADSNNKRSNNDDGLFRAVDRPNVWLFTCVHGDHDGAITLQWNDQLFDTRPQELRDLIQDLTNITIPHQDAIIITPCHPAEVMYRYGNELFNNRMDVVGLWSADTWVGRKYRTINGKNEYTISVAPTRDERNWINICS